MKTPTLTISLLPISEKPNPGREKQAAVNPLISKLASPSVDYIDIGANAITPRIKEIINSP